MLDQQQVTALFCFAHIGPALQMQDVIQKSEILIWVFQTSAEQRLERSHGLFERTRSITSL
jgi:hypothetical protein